MVSDSLALNVEKLDASNIEGWMQLDQPHVMVELTEGRVLKANQAAETLWSMTESELRDRRFADLFSNDFGPIFQNWAADADRSTLAQPVAPSLQFDPASEPLSTSWTLEAVKLAQGDACLCRLDERDQAGSEAEIRRLNWALEAYARSTRALVRARSVQEMAERVCSAIVEREEYGLAVMTMAEPLPSKAILPIALAGEAAGYFEGMSLSWDPAVTAGQGPTGRAVRAGRPYVMYDSLRDPSFRPWRDRAAHFGLRSSLSIPVKIEDQVIGVLLVYGTRPMAFTAREVQIFSELAEELAFAIAVLRDQERLDLARRAQSEAEAAVLAKQAELARVSRALTVGEFASSIAHEITQPISAIMTNCETALRWLKAEPPNIEGARQALERTLRDSDRAHGVIRRTRAFLAKDAPEMQSCDINAEIEEVAAFLRSELERAGIALTLRLAPKLPHIPGCAVQLQQVLINLVMNARDAMQSIEMQARQVTIQSTRSASGDIVVSVTDSGPGLQADIEDHLFEHFFTTKKGGMGLGLPISRSIIEMHGGTMGAEPASPQGMTFFFTLPSPERDKP